MARKKQATLKYTWYEYTPEALQSGVLSEKEIRDEYRRLRNIANKRIDRLEKAGYEVCRDHNHLCLFAGGGSYQLS